MIIPVREKSILIGVLVKMEKNHWTAIHIFAILDALQLLTPLSKSCWHEK